MVDMSPDNRRYIEGAVARGAYPNALAALDEAVWLLRQRDEIRAKLLAGQQQADRGELRPAEEVFEQLEKRAMEIERRARQAQ
jgi:Arc/MetJ-type ribon-helix-helix transcriptional regulator